MNSKLLLLIFVITLSSCSLAPVVSEKTARSLGGGNWETNVGLSPALNLTVGRGFGDNFDLHVSVESQIVSLVDVGAKYAILNNREGLSLAVFGGAFSDVANSSGYYAGPILSYKSGWFELYTLSKYNNVTWKADESTENDDSVFDFKLTEDQTFNYWQAVVGMNLWFADGFGINVNGKKLFIENSSEDGDELIPSLHFLFRY